MSSETGEGRKAKGAQELATAVAAAGLLAVLLSAVIWFLTPGPALNYASLAVLASGFTMGWVALMLPGLSEAARPLLGAGSALALLSAVVLNPSILLPVALLPLLLACVFLLSWGLRSCEAAQEWMRQRRRTLDGVEKAKSARPPRGGETRTQASALAESVGPAEAQEVPSASVYVTAGGRKYHREGCRHLRSGAMAVSLEHARARGCLPCSVCASRE